MKIYRIYLFPFYILFKISQNPNLISIFITIYKFCLIKNKKIKLYILKVKFSNS